MSRFVTLRTRRPSARRWLTPRAIPSILASLFLVAPGLAQKDRRPRVVPPGFGAKDTANAILHWVSGFEAGNLPPQGPVRATVDSDLE